MNNNLLHTEKLFKGRRSYFFDIKKNERGELYLKISESKKVGNDYEHQRIMIFEEDFADFEDTFRKAMSTTKQIKMD